MRNEFNKEDFYLPEAGLSEEQRKEALAKFDRYLEERKPRFLGFQADQALHYKKVLAKYLDFQINNLGDPYESGTFTINSKKIEQAVLDYYAKLWHGKPFNRNEDDSCWGYLLSMGSTEGNLYGLWNARDYLSGKPLSNPEINKDIKSEIDCYGPEEKLECRIHHSKIRILTKPADDCSEKSSESTTKPPVLFYSEDTHYSIVKSQHILGLKTFYDIGTTDYKNDCPLGGDWPTQVPSRNGLAGTGEIDIDNLVKLVAFFEDKNHPIIILFNYGTAFKGAYDHIECAWEKLKSILNRKQLCVSHYNADGKFLYVDKRQNYWIHVDGALGASYMPYIEKAYAEGLMPFVDVKPGDGECHKFPRFDFELPYINSISMSGHKWGGAPWPCGVYLTKRRFQLKPPTDPKYIGSPDSTLAGSRNGLSALILWNYLANTSVLEQVKKALYTQRIADYAHQRLLDLETELKSKQLVGPDGLWIQRPHLSLSVSFKKVRDDIMDKYSLNQETFKHADGKRSYNHIFAMEHVTEDTIDHLIEDLRTPGAFPPQNGEPSPNPLGYMF
jgi:histidine decarboxylase